MAKKNVLVWSTLLAIPFTLSACGDDDPPPTEPVDDPPTIQLTGPATGVTYAPGSSVDITWTATDDNQVAGVDLSYAADGVSSTSITMGETGSSFTWTLPDNALFGVSITATATDNAGQTATDDTDIFAVVAASARGYVTSTVCQNCHPAKWDDVFDSGHPYKLSKVVNNRAPTFPNSAVPSPPQGFTWGNITYVIGGYRWKARFLNDSGYILTGDVGAGIDGVPTQFNLARPDLAVPGVTLDTAWVGYHAADTERKPYTCGACHTTGWLTTADNGGVNQDGLPGIAGTWEEPGITCEQCHGAGGSHVATKSGANININRSAELCGSCHFRDTNHNILASGGYIRHHEQYDELVNGPKNSFSCTDCHNPHIGVNYGNAAMGGIVQTCEDCHPGQTVNHLPIDCESCHMPRASKSALAVNTYAADVKTHIFRIKPDSVGKDDMFFTDPTSGNTHTRGYVTLDFACYGCHNDLTGVGGGGSQRALSQLATRASGIHN